MPNTEKPDTRIPTEDYGEWKRRLAVYLFNIDGWEHLTEEQRHICASAAQWTQARVAEAVRALQAEVARLRGSLQDTLNAVARHVKRGERYEYRTSSEPMGVRGGVITSRRGDLCDVEQEVSSIVCAALARPSSTPVTTEGGEDVACRHCGHPWAALDGGDRLDDNGPIALVCDRCNRPWETTLSGGTTSTPTPTETENA